MSAEKILTDWKQKKYEPIYWLEGEENFFIDQLVHFAEHKILTESEEGFNLTIFYGKDADWAEVVNACRRYPVFADKQVVILKEAQQMRDLDKLEAYIENPVPSTLFIVAHKEKKLDGRSKLSRVLKNRAVLLSTKKLYENQLPDWASNLVQKLGYSISQKAVMLLVQHIGNDLSRINNEVQKLLLNIGDRKSITEEDIERYVGISKEYNVFELQDAMQKKDLEKAIRIIQYFESNPKAGPLPMVLASLYNYFSKVYQLFGVSSRDENAIASAIGVRSFFVKDYVNAQKRYGYAGIEQALLLLHEYNLKGIGINNSGTEDASLLKELVWKMVQ